MLLLCGQSSAQLAEIAVTAASGEVFLVSETRPASVGKVRMSLTQDSLVVHNGGNPAHFGPSVWTVEPWYFAGITARGLGDRVPQLFPLNGARPGGVMGDWTLVDAGAFKHSHHKAADPAFPWYADSLKYHMLDGGDTLYMRLTHASDPYELAWEPLAGSNERAAALLAFDTTLLQRFPLLQRTLSFYQFDASSANPNTTVRNFGWFLLPEQYVKKWTSWDIRWVSGWYAAADMALPGDGICNCHYSHDAWWFANYLFTGNRMSRTIGLHLVRQKIALGLFDVDAPYNSCWISGAWRGEKSGQSRRGAPLGPMATKEWDLGLCLAAALAPSDPFIQHGLAVRSQRLLVVNPGDIWNGAGGGRAVGNYLRNLRDVYTLTGDARFKQKADAFITHVWKKFDAAAAPWNAAHPGWPMLWFPNSLRTQYNATWEELIAHREIAWWCETEGVQTQRLPLLKSMVKWALDNAGAWRNQAAGVYEVAFEVGVETNGAAPTFGYKSFTTPTNGLWWVALVPTIKRWFPGAYDARMDAMVNTSCTRIGQGWADVDAGKPPMNPMAFSVDNAGEGPGGFKARAYAMGACRQ